MIATLLVFLLCTLFLTLAICVFTRFKGRYKRAFFAFLLLPWLFSTSVSVYIARFHFFGGAVESHVILATGIEYSKEIVVNDNLAVIHWLKIDLSRYQLSLVGELSSGGRLKARKTSQALEESDGLAAINGSFFTPFKDQHLFSYFPHVGDAILPVGFTQVEGVVIDHLRNDWPLLVISLAGEPKIISNVDEYNPVNALHALAGRSLLINNGKIAVVEDTAAYPRAVVGLTAKNSAYLVVVDGKQPGYSTGLSLHGLAQLMRERGITDAIELDGGGSATLAWKNNKKVELLNRPSHTKIPGRERPVANQLVVAVRDQVN